MDGFERSHVHRQRPGVDVESGDVPILCRITIAMVRRIDIVHMFQVHIGGQACIVPYSTET
jgi:hypothetical protein